MKNPSQPEGTVAQAGDGGGEAVRRLEAVTDTALAQLSLDALLDELLVRVRNLLGTDTAAILLLDGDTLVARAAKGLEEDVKEHIRLPLGRGFAGRVAAEARPIVEDVRRSEVANPILRQKGIRSLLGVPLLFEGRVIGVLQVGTLRRRRFGHADAQLLQVVADRIALGIAYAGLYEEERRARAEAELERERTRFLSNVSALFATSLDFEATLRNLAELVVPALADCCLIDILEDGGRLHRVQRCADTAKQTILDDLAARYPPRADRPAELIAAVRAGRPQLLPEIPASLWDALAEDEEHRRVIGRLGFSSLLVVPLAARGEIIGAITLIAGESQRRYTATDLGLAQEVAWRAGLAIDNARLYREAREARERLAHLYREAQEARAETEAASRAKDDFLATVSHELRTPLTPILVWARMLARGDLDDATTRQAVDTIERSARAQAQLVGDLLDVSRIIAGKLRLDIRPTRLADVIEGALQSMQPAADAKAIVLERRLGADVGVVAGDPDRLQQVVWNLISNAIKFTPRGGRVTLGLARSGSQVELRVSDSGKGISADFLPYLFERFRQGDSSSTRVHGGLGLGLAIVRHLVELHGGTVAAESPGEGRGAVFTVVLPAIAGMVEPAVTGTEPVHAGDDELRGVRVLVVDDEHDTCEAMKTVLEQTGAEVRACESATEALAQLEQWRPDVLMSDIGMPGEDGYSFIRKLRTREAGRPPIPAVAITAYARADDRARALAAGFQMHLAKPIEPDELVIAVASMAGRRTPADRLQ